MNGGVSGAPSERWKDWCIDRSLDPECVLFWAWSRLVTWWLLVKGYNPRGLDWEFPPSFTSVAYSLTKQTFIRLPMASPSSSVDNASQANSDITVCPSNPDSCRHVHCNWGQQASCHFQRALSTNVGFNSIFTVSLLDCLLLDVYWYLFQEARDSHDPYLTA